MSSIGVAVGVLNLALPCRTVSLILFHGPAPSLATTVAGFQAESSKSTVVQPLPFGLSLRPRGEGLGVREARQVASVTSVTVSFLEFSRMMRSTSPAGPSVLCALTA